MPKQYALAPNATSQRSEESLEASQFPGGTDAACLHHRWPAAFANTAKFAPSLFITLAWLKWTASSSFVVDGSAAAVAPTTADVHPPTVKQRLLSEP